MDQPNPLVNPEPGLGGLAEKPLITSNFIVIFILILCFVLSGTKGWLSFLLFPFSVVALPIVYIIYRNARKFVVGQPRIRNLMIFQFSLLLAFYLFAPGYGDTNIVNVVGFIQTDANSMLGITSQAIAYIAGPASLILTLILVGNLFSARRRARNSSLRKS